MRLRLERAAAAVVLAAAIFAGGLLVGKVALSTSSEPSLATEVAVGALAAQTGLEVYEVSTEEGSAGAYIVTVAAKGEKNWVKLWVVPAQQGGYVIADARNIEATP
jgi:hypothetical protein